MTRKAAAGSCSRPRSPAGWNIRHRPGLRPGQLQRLPVLRTCSIRGDSLKDAIERFHKGEAIETDPGRRSLIVREMLRRFTDVCNAIAYAHSRGASCIDIKPGNIIVGKYGETLVVDWGLAKPLGRVEPDRGPGERTLIPNSASGSAETLPGSALGTPAYMSPEQAFGDLDRLKSAQRRLR